MLEKLESDWIELFLGLQSTPKVEPESIQAPFVSVAPNGYDPHKIPSILCIGKATAAWYRSKLLKVKAPTGNTLRSFTSEFLKNDLAIRERYRSPFWRFVFKLSAQFAEATNRQDIAPLQNIVWTNICKIAVNDENPEGKYLEAQRELAIKTLREEIIRYRPTLIFLMTGSYVEDLIGHVVGDSTDRSWNQAKHEKHIWRWREPISEFPSVIWTGHPQGKLATTREVWIQKACELAIKYPGHW
jgi:hypothetical protein